MCKELIKAAQALMEPNVVRAPEIEVLIHKEMEKRGNKESEQVNELSPDTILSLDHRVVPNTTDEGRSMELMPIPEVEEPWPQSLWETIRNRKVGSTTLQSAPIPEIVLDNEFYPGDIQSLYGDAEMEDPKKKVHKPVKATLRLEVERLQMGYLDAEAILEGSRASNGSAEAGESTDRGYTNSVHGINRGPFNGQTKWLTPDLKDGRAARGSGGASASNDFRALDFRNFTRSEPFTQLLHCLYVYPRVASLSRKRNLFIRLELRRDDSDIRKPPLEAIYSTDGGQMLKWAHSQVAINTRTASYHDEFKIRLAAILTAQHHLLFTFFHVDLAMKLEAPKPVVVGYSVLPLSMNAQVLRSEVSLPLIRELVPHYLQDNIKERLDYCEDGRMVFKVRLQICSSLYPANERIRDFFMEYDRHVLQTSPPWGSELLEAINSLKNVDSTAMLQFLQPILNMLLQLIGDGGETLQVAAFRAMVNILTRVQQESSDGAERNRFLVQYVDYLFDDFGGRQPPVYPGLCTVWGSLARSKAKGYRVGPVYDDVLSMAWVFLELIVKSMALEQACTYSSSLPVGEEIPPLPLKDGVFRCVGQLYDCLLTEVHERCKKGIGLAKRLNSSLGFFCHDLLSVIDPRQVFELVALYINKFTGICQAPLHECKLSFLQIVCDHELYVEMPGREPSERSVMSSSKLLTFKDVAQELFLYELC
ncbi:hypothetical protein L7F22_064470 [Adiantum nelumboides]|nr:hypothetical protein [Adiantum nelumboides]